MGSAVWPKTPSNEVFDQGPERRDEAAHVVAETGSRRTQPRRKQLGEIDRVAGKQRKLAESHHGHHHPDLPEVFRNQKTANVLTKAARKAIAKVGLRPMRWASAPKPNIPRAAPRFMAIDA